MPARVDQSRDTATPPLRRLRPSKSSLRGSPGSAGTPCDNDRVGTGRASGGPEPPLLVVDAANVVGSVPDGWWRDRAAAAGRLRDALVTVATEGLPGLAAPVEVVLVVEGEASVITGVEGVRVVAAPASGDDTVVELVTRAGPGRRRAVVTADRGLRERVRAVGAELISPRAVPRRL